MKWNAVLIDIDLKTMANHSFHFGHRVVDRRYAVARTVNARRTDENQKAISIDLPATLHAIDARQMNREQIGMPVTEWTLIENWKKFSASFQSKSANIAVIDVLFRIYH